MNIVRQRFPPERDNLDEIDRKMRNMRLNEKQKRVLGNIQFNLKIGELSNLLLQIAYIYID